MSQNSIVTTKSLNKIFKISSDSIFSKSTKKDIHALNNVNLQIDKGEFVALLGPNGAGKSTLIKVLIGVLAYDSGEVKVLGHEPLNNREKIISRLGIVFGQRSRMWYDLPVKESFELTKRLYISGYPRTKNKKLVDWEKFLIDSIGLGNLLDRQVKKLSLGEKMRCELVNTLLYNPDLIFLDEPTIGLDVVSKQRIREALSILHQNGKTILLTSHDTGDIEKLCQRVVVINHGEVVVDLSMDKFMQLNDDIGIRVRLKNKITQATLAGFKKLNVIAKKTSDYEVNLTGKKQDRNAIVKFIFTKFDVTDIDFESEKVESILVDIYEEEKKYG